MGVEIQVGAEKRYTSDVFVGAVTLQGQKVGLDQKDAAARCRHFCLQSQGAIMHWFGTHRS